ncbi:MAG: hypothetical protein QOK48_3138 [Blastocatellia bacterium]|nr:hypothetical protein [Blastocatellia bacterium]
MPGHSDRSSYYIVGEGLCDTNLMEGCPVHSAAAPAVAGAEPEFKFDRMWKEFPNEYKTEDYENINRKLIELGQRMIAPPTVLQPASENPGDPGIPAGYTYLGQFIAHEITFDKTVPTTLPAPGMPLVPNYRSPSVDLDSLYGAGPVNDRKLYEDDGIRLKIGKTFNGDQMGLPCDLFRGEDKRAVIADERNDENLPVAQTQVALIHFHNKVVEALKDSYAEGELLKQVRDQVIRHVQWIILNDYLPRIVDQQTLDSVRGNGLKWFRVTSRKDLFMPLEFSAAAFRIGHSMVRNSYQWNRDHHTAQFRRPASLGDIFAQTGKNGQLGGHPRLANDWVIDWRRFYNFTELSHIPPVPENGFNMARRIDTNLDLHIELIGGFDNQGLADDRKSITVRNLLTGFRVGLPTGEQVAEWIGGTPLTHAEVVGQSQLGDILGDPVFKDKTPLWYYILREAEIAAAQQPDVYHLGPVGSRIIAETLVGIIKNSETSVLADPDWSPRFGRPAVDGAPARFDMIDLLDFAGVVNPLG